MGHNEFSQKPRLRGLWGYLRQIPVFDVDPGHAVQPRFSELWSAGVGLGQTVLKVHQHLRVIFMLLHLGGGHQNGAYPFGQVLHIRGEGGVLTRVEEGHLAFSCIVPVHIHIRR